MSLTIWRTFTRSFAAGGLAALASAAAHANEAKVLLSLDPSDRGTVPIVTATPAASLGKAIGAPVQMLASYDLKDSMRATRTTENQVIIGPAHVMASALSHGYVLAAASGKDTRFALVVRPDVADAKQLKGTRLYLPQQDSLRSYVAKGLLDQVGLSLKSFSKVEFQNTSGAGMVAIQLGMADATVAEVHEAEAWLKDNPGKAKLLQVSREVPGGVGVAMHSSLPAADQTKIARWATATPSPIPGFVAFEPGSAAIRDKYTYVASLGIFTPESIDGAQRVSAEQVRELAAKGGVAIVDTRSAREYAQEHIPNAVSAPYGEKSLKERNYDVKVDDLGAIAKLDPNKPTVFLCNGPECWKSYKASREALAMGFKTVYWFRGGMPEWRAKGLATVKADAQQTAQAGK